MWPDNLVLLSVLFVFGETHSLTEMVQITGKYQVERNENMEQYVKETGVSDEVAKKVIELGSTTEIVKDGNKLTVTISFGVSVSFTLNEEFEEPLIEGLKSVAKLDGNVLSINSKFANGNVCVRSYEFTDDAMVGVMTLNGVTGKRYYKRL